MVVDRYPLVTQAAAKQLHALGMHPTTVNDSSTVIEMLADAEASKEPYQLILLDADSGPVDGISLARQVRADKRLGEIGLIITSSIARPMKPSVINSLTKALCISKPLLPASLREACIEVTIGSPHERVMQSSRAEDFHGSCEDLRTIVVEDNPVSREMLLKMLTVYSCEADSAADGAEALRLATEENYTLMLLDCQMPQMDGYEVATAIRQRESEAGTSEKLVIVAVTANASLADQTRCLSLGFNDYLPKPVRLMDLEKLLIKWFPDRFNQKGVAATKPLLVASNPQINAPVAQKDPVNKAAWECFMDEPEKLDKLFHLFIDDAESGIQDTRKLITEGDPVKLARAAHALKSGCLQIGAEVMADYCKKIEHSDSIEESSKYLSQIEVEFIRVQEFLSEISDKGRM
jgi:CheY-like chemotaxis protein